MSTIAFLGLGQMGEPMARRLLEAGHELTVWDRTRDRTEGLVGLGARAAATPAAAVSGSQVAVTMLASPDAVEQVIHGPAGAVHGMSPGQTLVEMSTIGPKAFKAITGRLPDGVHAIDAPVLGSVPQATEGKLRIFVGASDEDFERIRDILAPLGDARHMGPPGSGAATKLVVNLTLGSVMAAFGEALALAKALGLEQEAMLDVLAVSPIGATVGSKRGNVESGQYPPNFKLRHAVKDLRLVEEAAHEGGLDLKTARAAEDWLDEALAQGAGDLDYSAVVATIMGQKAA